MPLSTILVLVGIVAVFTVFGVVLAWGDSQTRDLHRNRAKPEAAGRAELQFDKAA